MLPIDVHVHTNTNCNLHCIHCYEDADDLSAKSIDVDLEIGLIEYLCSKYDADIHLEGGEVFLEEGLLESLSKLDAATRKRLTITTNGTIRIDDSITSILSSVGCLRISVEGHSDELQAAVRGCELSHILENALFYKTMGCPVSLRITANNLNYRQMFSEVIPSLQKRGFDDFQIYEMQPVGRGKTSDLCINEPLTELYEGWFKNKPNANIKLSLPHKRKSEILEYISRFESLGINTHDNGNIASISIGVDGAVRICPWDTTSEPLLICAKSNMSTLSEIIRMQTYSHFCDYCSRIVLSGGKM